MFKFKNFQEYLTEALLPHERKEVDTWGRGDNSFSDHMYKKSPDEHRAHFDLEHPTAGHRSDIEEHIKPHGFEVKDYQKGVAKDKYGRDVNIGRVLHRTKAPDELKKKFENDPSRQQLSAKSDTHKIIISRHPHDVAGMTSHGHSWECESCMNFNTGSKKHHLKHDVKQGTHVAYLVHKDDHNIENPLARIALKRYTNIDNPNDHILRPEHRTYGDAPDSFHHSVNKILNQHFAGKEDAIYKKHKDVYDDSGNSHIIGKNAIDKHLDTKDEDLLDHLTRHPDLQSHHIEHLLKNKFAPKSYLLSHENVSPKTLDEAYDKIHDKKGGYAPDLVRQIGSHKKASPETLRKIHKGWMASIHPDYINNPNLPEDVIHELLENKHDHHHELGKNPNITKNIIKKYLKTGLDHKFYHNILKFNENSHKILDSDLIRDIYHNRHVKAPRHEFLHDLQANLAEHKNAPLDVMRHFFTDDDQRLMRKRSVLHKKDFSKEDLEKLKDDNHPFLKQHLMIHKNAPDEWFDEHVKNMKPEDLNNIIMFGRNKIKEHHIPELIKKTTDDEQLKTITQLPQFKPEHHEHIMNHDNINLRGAGLTDHEKLTSEGLHKYMDSHENKNMGYIHNITTHPKFDKSHVKRILSHPESTKHYESIINHQYRNLLPHASTEDISNFINKNRKHFDEDGHAFLSKMMSEDKVSPEVLKTFHKHEKDTIRKLAKRKSKEYKDKE